MGSDKLELTGGASRGNLQPQKINDMSFNFHELLDKGCIAGNGLQFLNVPGFSMATLALPYAERIGNFMLVVLLRGCHPISKFT